MATTSEPNEKLTMADVRVRECRHFNGIQHGTCLAGINYADVRDESVRPFLFPCIASGFKLLSCDKREPWTRAEAEEQDKAAELRTGRVLLCLQAIRVKHGRERGCQGQMPCPTDCGGTLSYGIASNGHVQASCSTANCAEFMQ